MNGFIFPFALHADWLGLPNRVFEYLVSEADPGFGLDCLLACLYSLSLCDSRGGFELVRSEWLKGHCHWGEIVAGSAGVCLFGI